MNTSSSHNERRLQEPIAIIGSGCRFPGSSNTPSKLWDLLHSPRDILSKIPKERFNADAFYHPNGMHHGTSNVTQSYFLHEDHRVFDAGFFNVKPVEAHSIDPQQRLLLETVYEALETSGSSIESLAGSQTGVYVGLMCGDYSEHLQRDVDVLPTYMPTGTARSIISNRVSYFFDWHGPSMTIDTACSSSLVAVHQAVQLLRSGESEVAIAAGANLILGPELYMGESKLKMLSPGSRSRMWDIDADGYARGEGIAAVVMKTLSKAIKDGDHIECIIRESGINQDGKTKGITMPSELAQANLIARTYAKAGLDPRNRDERCQYFEAHGTGTLVGDAREAEAIGKAFFGPDARSLNPEDLLYVGSIKTVIGHTEGTAGLAGLLKASLALQNAIIPPNMLFHTLSPAVAPFYNNLKIATTAEPWPKVSEGDPRRASVNSFGFGGTNAHVILESFTPTERQQGPCTTAVTPLIFSAASESALQAMLIAYSTHILDNATLSLPDLSYTLHTKRSTLPVRAAFAATSPMDLVTKMKGHLESASANKGHAVGVRSLAAPPCILGVFTGQGAQWATMGSQLIRESAYVREILQDLDCTLQTLPEAHRPSWSLVNEILADSLNSRLDEALIAQPLCTAVQIALVDLLSKAGVHFKAVVGHSSGEIAAAYAAGFISRSDAVRLAYYRGLFTKLAGRDKPGAMIAVGTSMEDAIELCELPMFEGRLSVAACNSSASVTVSGDADAIEEAKEVFEQEKKFARLLKVDKAYHSHHMIPCAEPYLDALTACHIKPRQPKNGCVWFSSRYQGTKMDLSDDLKGVYWKDNMASPVFFSQAIQAAADQEGPFNLAIELGPHPALRGPALQNLQDVSGQNVPYTGTLSRGVNDVEAISAALGFVWAQLSSSIVDFNSYDALVSGSNGRQLLTSLPTYPWDHDRVFWHDSRATKAYRNRKDPPHSLLGARITNGVDEEVHWRNLLRPSELPWIHGHQLQGQMVLPAAAYIASAVEAARFLAIDMPVGVIDVCDFMIGKPLTFDDEESGVETLFTVSKISKNSVGDLSATFSYHACTNRESETLTRLASGRVIVTIGEPSTDWLPLRAPEPPNMADVDVGQFYSSLDHLGYGYTGDFRSLSGMKRKLNYGSAYLSVPSKDDSTADVLLIHPATLDMAFQAIFLAYWWPNDGSLEQLHVPTSIRNIRINFALCQKEMSPGAVLPLISYLTENPLTTSIINGDVDIFAMDGHTKLIQVEGVKVVPFSEGSAQYDRQMFSEHIWGPAFPDCELAIAGSRATADDYKLATFLERVSLFYMKNLDSVVPKEQRLNLNWHHEALFEFTSHILSQTRAGRQPFCKKEWLDDTWGEIKAIMDLYPDSIEMKLTRTVGENLPATVRGESPILQHLLEDNLLNNYYTDAMGITEPTEFLARTIAQTVHRYPHMNILEIGAGTGGATKSIMRLIGRAFSSYTFTDISTGFFEAAQGLFLEQADKMVFKALDAEKDVVEQGYIEHSYDLVIGSLVLHATTSLQKTMENTRRLLKPGGYLILLEITNNDVIRTGFAMSGLPGWWLGRNDGRRLSPCVSSTKWHKVFLKTGFSGISSLSPENDILPRPLSVIVTQAVDDRISLLREPLLHPEADLGPGKFDLVIIGGHSFHSIVLIDGILQLLRPWDISITHLQSLQDLDSVQISPTSYVLSVTDLDKPIFENLTIESMGSLKKLFDFQRTIIWVTRGCRADEPYMNMMVGFGRSLTLEMPDIRLQFLDLDTSEKPNPSLLAEAVLRLRLTAMWETIGTTGDILWSTEQELAYEKGRPMIPRLVLNKKLNDRYNASGRTIIETKDVQKSSVSLQRSGSGYNLVEHDSLSGNFRTSQLKRLNPTTMVRVTQSLELSTTPSQSDQVYAILGTDINNEKTVLGLSTVNASCVAIHPQMLVGCNVAQGKEVRLFSLLDVELKTESLLSACGQSSTLVIHEPGLRLAARLAQRSPEKNLTVLFTTSSSTPRGDSWITIHPRSPKRFIKAALFQHVSIFVSCSVSGSESEGLGELIASCLPEQCWRSTIKEILAHREHGRLSEQQLLQKLKDAANILDLESATDLSADSLVVMRPEDVARSKDHSRVDSVITDWTAADQVPIKLVSVDSQTHFTSNKTYVLFGLTSDLGLSLSDWMVSHGARNLVLTSRNPKIDERWLKLMDAAGVRVRVFANDITNRVALKAVIREIQNTFPPVAGIAHGAMALEDASFSEMSFETMEKVLRPKVLGAIYLNELFQDDSLDFFVFFSSLAAVSGNRGQTNYSAANMYMTALACQRRQKGLAASVLHIGAIMGVGYVTREVSNIVFAAIRKAGFQWMSERGFHQCFAEAIIAGRPQSGLNPEIVTGLRVINTSDEEPAPWTNIPRFQHCLIRGGTEKSKLGSEDAALPVKARLLGASTPEEVFMIIKSAFFIKLQVALQLPLETVAAQEQVLASSADDLGIDSLVAVEVRSWFLKELEVDMPVLKILGGATIADLVTFAQEKLPADMTPGMGVIPNVPPVSSEPESQTGSAITAPIETSHEPIGSNTTTFKSGSAQGDKDQDSSLFSTPPESVDVVPTFLETTMQKVLPMSPAQSRFWFLRQFLDDKTTTNITFSLKLKGKIRLADFENAITMMGVRHEALRTCFFTNKMQEPMQGVLHKSLLRLERKPIQNAQEVAQEFKLLTDYNFDIERGETMRILLLSLTETVNFLIIAYHHINMDGVSLEVFLSDLEKAYNHKALPEPVLQYSDYSSRQQQELKNGGMKSELKFWMDEMTDVPPPLPLLPFSSSRSRMPLDNYNHNREDLRIDASLAAQIKEICREQKANVFHFYLAVYEVMLFRLLDITDLCIGMADANRGDDATAKSMGAYLNILPLRFQLNSKQTFKDVLKNTRRKAYSAMANSRLPFDILLENLKTPRSTSHSPLFQAFVNYRQGVNEKRSFGGFNGEGAEYAFGRTAYDISLDILDNPSGATLVMFLVQKQLYSNKDAQSLGKIYLSLLNQFSQAPTSPLDEAFLFTAEDIGHAIKLGQGPTLKSEWPQTLIHRIDDIAVKQPNSIALKDTFGNDWTYQRMANRIHQIAHALLNARIAQRSHIAVFQEPSPDWVCSLLAVMRIGAVYVPLDKNTPSVRLATIVGTCHPSAILVDDVSAADVGGLHLPQTTSILNVSTVGKSTIKTPVMAQPSDVAVILYTSGTTGIPKGIKLSHSGLRNQIEGVIKVYNFGPETILQQSALGFDLTLDQIFTALGNGGSLVVAPRSLRGDSIAIARLIVQEKITYTSATPSEYLSWLQYGGAELRQSQNWIFALSVGEQYPLKLVEAFQKLGRQRGRPLSLSNIYGPSEVTVSCSRIQILFDKVPDQRIAAGHTLPNCSVYIVDDQLKPLPVGMPGEVCVGGAGVAIDYLNHDQVTQRFIPDPFAPSRFIENRWTRMYRTGDRGVLREDGALEILGRIDGDTQIKLRGIRVEMEDIESTILRATKGAITEVVVIPRGDPLTLMAYAVLSPSAIADDQNKFLQRLASTLPLPQYMRPAAIVPIESMPLSAHGKVDRRYLASLAVTPGFDKPAPSKDLSGMEARLLQTWEEVLPEQIMQINHIDRESDFFHVGGNSMLLIKLQGLIRNKFNVLLSAMRLFECSTLGAMAAAIEGSSEGNSSAIDWEQETTLPGELLQTYAFKTAKSASYVPRTIVLTGSTGFLGKEILRQLVAASSVDKVHCLAVRVEGKLDEFLHSQKVIVHGGDLSLPRCGLSEKAADLIFRETDAIIHNGADVSFLKTYQSLKRSNVDSTKELVKLTLGRRIPFHYISSVVAGRLNGSDTFGEVSLTSFPPPPGFADGYAATKWASEVFLEKAHAHLSLPVWIHRPSSITGDGVGELDVMHNLLKFSRLLKAVPESDQWKGYLDFISVEHTASGILQEVLNAQSEDATSAPLKYFHQSGDLVIPLASLKEFFEKESGSSFEPMRLGEWVGRAKEQGLNALVAGYLTAVDDTQVKVVFQKLVKSGGV